MSFYKTPTPIHPEVAVAMKQLAMSLQHLKLRNDVQVPLVEGYLLICESGSNFNYRDLSRITIKSISTDRTLRSHSIHELKKGMVSPILNVWGDFIDKVEKQYLLEKEEDRKANETKKTIELLIDSHPETLKRPPPLQKARHDFNQSEEFDSSEG